MALGSAVVRMRLPSVRAQRIARPGVSAIVAGVSVLAWLLAVTLTGSPVGDVVRWAVAVVLGILAPGFVVVRLSRRAVAPLIEDVSWSAAAGCLVALFGWFLDRVLPLAPGPLIVGPAIVVLAVAFPAGRRRVLARPAPGWGPGPALALGCVVLISIAWMMATGLLAYGTDPGVHGTAYYPDIMYQLDLVGELRHSLVPTYAPVAGTSLSYHWFLYAITSHLLTHTGVNPFDSTLRLGPATLVPAILMISAVVARRLSGYVWAGPVAAALLGVVTNSQASKWTVADGSIGILPYNWRASPPQTMGWLASMAAAGALFAFLRRASQDREVPVGLLIPLLVLTAGSKSSELPVLIAGVALATVVQALRRDWPLLRRCLLALVAMLAVFELASVTIYGGSSYGVKLQLLGVARSRVHAEFPGFGTRTSTDFIAGVHSPLVALGAVSVLFVLPLLPRLLGLVFQLRYRPGDSAGWVCAGTAVAGLALPFLLRHPAGSEIYFMLSAYPIGVVGAASGLVVAARRVRRAMPSAIAARRFGVWSGVVLLIGALSAAVVANAQPRFDPGLRVAGARTASTATPSLARLVWMWVTPTFIWLVLILVLLLIAAPVVRRSWPERLDRADVSSPDTGDALLEGNPRQRLRRAPLVGLSAVCLALGPGLFATALYFGGADTPAGGSVAAVHPKVTAARTPSLPPVMRDGLAAGRWVDAHAKADDVVATNMYCRFTRAARRRGDPCDARNFIASALTQRRTLVGGWAYSDRVVASAWNLKTSYHNAPFWNRKLLTQQYDAFAHPTTALLNQLYRADHVRWMFLDLRDGPVDDTALNRIAILRFLGPSTGVWELRTPAATPGG